MMSSSVPTATLTFLGEGGVRPALKITLRGLCRVCVSENAAGPRVTQIETVDRYGQITLEGPEREDEQQQQQQQPPLEDDWNGRINCSNSSSSAPTPPRENDRYFDVAAGKGEPSVSASREFSEAVRVWCRNQRQEAPCKDDVMRRRRRTRRRYDSAPPPARDNATDAEKLSEALD
jgi:hypothetical protein